MIEAHQPPAELTIPENLPLSQLIAPLVAAEDALARMDERLRTSRIREGFISRLHYADACASMWLEGELVSLEDLVLHDAAADVRAPTPQLARARTVLRTRRIISDQPPGRALERGGLALLSGEPAADKEFATEMSRHGSRSADTDETGLDDALSALDEVLSRTGRVLSGENIETPPSPALTTTEDLRRMADSLEHLPPLLAAGLLWDRWEAHPPASGRAWLGRQLVADYLRARGKAAAHLPAINSGLRTVPWEHRRARDGGARLRAWLEAAQAGALAGLREHDRLVAALATLERKSSGRRVTSRLQDLVELAAAHPLLTAATVAQALGITQRAARNLVAELGLRETTGRGRYRVWML